MLELTRQEFESLRSQIVDSKRGGTRYPPFAFTRQGVAMLSSVLNSEKGILLNIAIIRVFIKLRQMALTYSELTQKIKELEQKYDRPFADVYEALNLLLMDKENQANWENRERIGFKSPGTP